MARSRRSIDGPSGRAVNPSNRSSTMRRSSGSNQMSIRAAVLGPVRRSPSPSESPFGARLVPTKCSSRRPSASRSTSGGPMSYPRRSRRSSLPRLRDSRARSSSRRLTGPRTMRADVPSECCMLDQCASPSNPPARTAPSGSVRVITYFGPLMCSMPSVARHRFPGPREPARRGASTRGSPARSSDPPVSICSRLRQSARRRRDPARASRRGSRGRSWRPERQGRQDVGPGSCSADILDRSISVRSRRSWSICTSTALRRIRPSGDRRRCRSASRGCGS